MIQSPASYNDGKWHFVVATQGSDGMHLYVDGAQVVSGPTTAAQAYTGYWQLGIAANNGWPNRTAGAFVGSLSDAAEFLSELSPAQVLAQYQAASQSLAAQSVTVTSTAPSGVVVGGASYTPTATASSGLAVAITLDGSSTGCALSGGVVSFTAVGTCVIDFNQAGNAHAQRGAAEAAVDCGGCGDEDGAVGDGDLDGAEWCGGWGCVVYADGDGVVGVGGGDHAGWVEYRVCVEWWGGVVHGGGDVCDRFQPGGQRELSAAPQKQQSIAVGRGRRRRSR